MIDHHVHLGSDRKTSFTLSEEEISSRLDNYCLNGAIIFSCPNVEPAQRNPYALANTRVLNASGKDRRLIPFLFTHPFLDDIGYIESAQGPFKGFKIYPKAEGMKYSYEDFDGEIAEYLISTNKPLVFHTDSRDGNRIKNLSKFIKNKKTGEIVLSHSGDLIEEDLDFASGYPFIMIDLSPLATMLQNNFFAEENQRPRELRSLCLESVLEYLLKKFGPNNILWGSDAPWCDKLVYGGYDSEVEVLRRMKLMGITSELTIK